MNPLESWQEEQRSAFLYRICAQAETGNPRADLFQRLAGEAEAQAAIWRAQLTARGHPAPPPFVPDLRTRMVAALVRAIGPRPLKGILAAMKVRGMAVYSSAAPIEPGHAGPRPGGGMEHRHRGLGSGGNLRAAVFGVNDGLVSNASLILGVAGASADARVVLLSGIAGMCAGAFAMAAGEYVSVRSQRELFEYQIGLEREELREYPEAEAQELALIYVAKGLPKKEAARLATRLIADPEHALDTLAREELGLNPDELGSPWGAALSSFVAFGAGALLPLLPFVFLAGPLALPVAVGLTGLALFGVGATLSLFTGRNAAFSGLRMLALGGLAGAITFAIGRLAGVTLG
ncbi:MAG: VIT1/CCC1 transporter family protein [Betaproteobacteria bacterium]|jgi:VIT1/CCC1 family predicted Fe2+/Mn2+ transporter|nr:VIT1/CCC1 transporter family protein [Betaproteobacteria bacterium]MBK7743562.1 VIT1/CCC1 transporter family protein [Betaproteobacteria bacterium]MBK8687120.1 VIT1/CCC1 transporter family protein [Betaproteobacteria bacterium]